MRPRPFGLIKIYPIINIMNYSFPSTHTMIIFSVLPILDKEFPKLKYIWLILAIIIGFSRIYLGQHYLSDVIFGGVLGYLVGLFIVNRVKK
jgi:undecaprenyl-diphosphatase